MSTFSRIIFSLKGFSLNFSQVNRSIIVQGDLRAHVGVRGIYTHTRDTGIKIFDQNVKQLNYNGQEIPTYLSSCPDLSQKEMEDLYAAFPQVVQDFTSLPATARFSRGNERTRELLEYCATWSPTAAAHTMMADRFYSRKRRLENKVVSEEDEKERLSRAHQLAWCIELIIRPAYMTDDIMDNHDKRNGLPTWNSLPHIGLGAVNDSALMSQGGYILLHKYFGHEDYYLHLLRTLYDGLLVTQVGQNYEKLVDMFSKDTTLESILISKGIWSAAVFPNICIIGAMLINGVRDLELERLVNEAGEDAALYMMMIEDVADCFLGDVVSQRQTKDISAGKQNWVLYTALKLASPEQHERLKINYGKDVENVLKVYKELNIKEAALKMADEAYEKLMTNLNQFPQNEIPINILLTLCNHYRAVEQGAACRI